VRDVLQVFYRVDRRREGKTLDLLDIFASVRHSHNRCREACCCCWVGAPVGVFLQLFLCLQRYEELKTDVFRIEKHLLRALGFVMHVEHPHKFVLNYLQILECSKNPQLMQEAWSLTNDR
jgi:hypothetical protein